MEIMFIVIGVAFLCVFLAFVKFGDNQAKTKAVARKSSGGILSNDQYLKIAHFLDENFMTRSSFYRIRDQVSLLSIYDSQEIKIQATKFWMVSRFAFLAIVISGMIIFDDIFSVMLCIAFALVIETTMVGKQLDRTHFKVLSQLQTTLSSIRQQYLRNNYVPDALRDCEKASLIQRPIDAIYNILTSSNSARKLDEYYATIPFKKLQTIAGVCWFINDKGDTKDYRGMLNFEIATGMIQEEVDLEMTNIIKQRNSFGVLEILPIAPLPAISIVTNYFSGIIPGTSVIYNGMLGFISKIVVVLLGIIGYYTITNINRTVSIREDDRLLYIKRLLSIESFSLFIDSIKPKKTKRKMALGRKLKKALSQKRDREIYAEKIVWATIGFTLSLISLFVTINLSREFIYNNPRTLSLISTENLTQEVIQKRLALDERYLAFRIPPSLVWTTDLVREEWGKDLDTMQRDEEVHRMMEKYKSYHNTSFKWWMLLIIYAITFVCWKVPEIGLFARSTMIKVETEEDVLQMQTMIAILMNTPVDTLDTLYWMGRQSRLHKNVLLDCYNDYPSDPELALAVLKERTTSPEFKQIIDKLLSTVKEMSLADAFSDLVARRDYVMRLREMTQETILNRKRMICKPLALAPIGALAVLHLLLPIGILGFSEFKKAMESINL